MKATDFCSMTSLKYMPNSMSPFPYSFDDSAGFFLTSVLEHNATGQRLCERVAETAVSDASVSTSNGISGSIEMTTVL